MWAPAVCVGLFFGLWAIVADMTFDDAVEGASADNFSGIAAWYRLDPMAAAIVAAATGDVSDPTREQLQMSRTWAQRAVDLDPDNPTWRAAMAVREFRLDDLEAARRSADEALALQRDNVVALHVLEIVAQRTGDDQLHDDVTAHLCSISTSVCPTSTDGA
jgi:hypothetical protein